MLVLNLPFKALMFLTLMRPSLVLFLVLWLKLVKDFLKVRCRLALLPFLISCLIWLDLVASLPLIKERILVIILLLHFLSLMLGSVLVLMLPLLVWLTPDLRIKKSLLKCNWTIRKRLPRCKMRLKKRLLAFSRRLHARIRKTRYMHKMRCLLINRRSLLLALRLVRFQTALASIKLIQASAVLYLTEDDFDFLTSNKVWIATDRSRARRCVEACVYGTLDFVGYPRFPAPVEFIAAVIAYYVHPVNIQTACLIMEGAEFTENIINGVERPVKAAELFAFTLRVRAGNTDVLTDAEENVRQKLRAEGVM